MYKILIKSKNSSKMYSFYSKIVKDTEVIYETSSIDEAGETYKSLLSNYTTDQLKIVQDIEPEITVTVEDNLPAE